MGISGYLMILAVACIFLFVWGICKRNKIITAIAVIIGAGLALFVYLLGQALSTM
ncbi:MAG: hypothetical protein LBP64_01030 [Tannerella sp.]|jgi:hypothetical protein|nr:hypothetical protein [Tannerella sp.]